MAMPVSICPGKEAPMKLFSVLTLLLAALLTAAGCASFQLEAGFKTPAELTATAEAQVAGRNPKPQLGRLAFVRGGDIWVQDLPDGKAVRLTQDGRNDTPLWSPSGEWLAFRKGVTTAGLYQLWIARATGTDARSIDIVRSGMGRQIDWSPVEDRIAYISRNGLYVVDVDGGTPRELVAPSPRLGAGVESLAWSPDGQWVAMEKRDLEGSSKPEQGQTPPRPTAQGLWRAKADGSAIESVYLNPDPVQTQSYLAGWSPDGQFLLFWQGQQMSGSFLADGAPLMRVPITGGIPVQLTKMLARLDFLTWAPDGQKLALVDGTYRSTWHRKTIAVATLFGGLEGISGADRTDIFPTWSPDGRSIAYTSAPAVATDGGNDAKQAGGQRRIWVMAPDGSGKHQLTDDARFQDERPRWSADGDHLLFARLEGEQAQLWLMRADGSDLKQVVDELTPSPGWFGYYGYIEWGQLYDWWTGMPL
ncbi:MAG: hypothetical protein EPO21_14535 [Chloroflexota bacterium]|nr:MAG: hypothetical protein EPO21_14535 [Chloroflexota bacterium]